MKQGNCPNCNSNDLDYDTIDDSTPGEQVVHYNFECGNCGFKGKECYKLVFTGYTDENNTSITEDDKDYCEKGNGCKHLGENTCANSFKGCYEERS